MGSKRWHCCGFAREFHQTDGGRSGVSHEDCYQTAIRSEAVCVETGEVKALPFKAVEVGSYAFYARQRVGKTLQYNQIDIRMRQRIGAQNADRACTCGCLAAHKTPECGMRYAVIHEPVLMGKVFLMGDILHK